MAPPYGKSRDGSTVRGRFRGLDRKRVGAAAHDARRNAHGSCVVRNIRNDHGVGADAGMGPDGDGPDDLGARTDEHMIAKARAAAAVGSNGDLVFDMNARAALAPAR